MSSEIIKTTVQQVGKIMTNPNAIVPEVSNPIQQVNISTIHIFNTIIEQVGLARSATNSILQKIPLVFAGIPNSVFGSPPSPDSSIAQIIEQIFISSQPIPNSGDPYKGPIEQNKFGTKGKILNIPSTVLDPSPIEQFIITTNTNTSRPVELIPRAINNINITQFDFIDLIFPPCNSIKNPIETNILWRIKDLGFPFDTQTLIFIVNGVPVQNKPQFIITNITNGLQLDFDPPDNFSFSSETEIVLQIDDTAAPPNRIFFRCRWKTVDDTFAPQIINLIPACDSTNIPVTSPIQFDIIDTGVGIDLNSFRLSIEGITVCSGITSDAISIPGTGIGFHINFEHLDKPFRFGSFVTIGIEVSDLSKSKNSTLFVCCFETEDSKGPTFSNFKPRQCKTFVDNATGLTFDVFEVEDGIDISTLEVRVDNELRKVFVTPRILRSQ